MTQTATLSCMQTRPARSLISTLLAFGSLYNQRRALARLDDHALNDLGLTRHEALCEARRPVWDAPDNWHA
ncbi:DUF1127 domain-containing protein [Puniceibacterium sediminis]|uniref:Uncharacterized conserved protein YjiS, DUF1127 family n=1 Tax=Puniceibacterium sediminis TaxID=1608407 RepID=A0A238XE61_9RHOB|nr:DUF1127 domain-containing protein [Puniceibacterium sediminis]SNR56189.1 Uncharacterized conserved protein YjiS, DUF1127 family [Puniceibacterium sediminis]